MSDVQGCPQTGGLSALEEGFLKMARASFILYFILHATGGGLCPEWLVAVLATDIYAHLCLEDLLHLTPPNAVATQPLLRPVLVTWGNWVLPRQSGQQPHSRISSVAKCMRAWKLRCRYFLQKRLSRPYTWAG